VDQTADRGLAYSKKQSAKWYLFAVLSGAAYPFLLVPTAMLFLFDGEGDLAPLARVIYFTAILLIPGLFVGPLTFAAWRTPGVRIGGRVLGVALSLVSAGLVFVAVRALLQR
jgi:hypothetical protein